VIFNYKYEIPLEFFLKTKTQDEYSPTGRFILYHKQDYEN
jgi:hypothetical protein